MKSTKRDKKPYTHKYTNNKYKETKLTTSSKNYEKQQHKYKGEISKGANLSKYENSPLIFERIHGNLCLT